MHGQYLKPEHSNGNPLRNIALGVVVTAAVGALLVGAYTLGYDKGKPNEPAQKQAKVPAGGQPAGGGGQAEAKQLFTTSCGACHVLSDAGTKGVQGPNLDDLKPNAKAVEEQIKNGGGGMPAGLLTGAEAHAVSKYTATVAGKQ